MEFALVNGDRAPPAPKGRGTCPTCGSEMVAKCGPRVMHHWAHAGQRNCDPWWENETPWHRQWKAMFPPECREVAHVAEDGEVHRADIKTRTGIVVEVQHSQMTDAERMSRESFYQNMIWILDGSVFSKNFDIYHQLPHPSSPVALDLLWIKAKRHLHGANRGIFLRMSEVVAEDPMATRATYTGGGWMHFYQDIQQDVLDAYRGHHQYDWVRPRRTWLDATCPVYIDFGHEWVARLETYDDSNLPCVCLISKRRLVSDLTAVNQAGKVAMTKFEPFMTDIPR